MNILLNGGFDFDQEHEGASINLGSSTFLCDGLIGQLVSGNGGAIAVQRVTDAPPGANYSMKATVTTAASSVGITDKALFRFPIGGDQTTDLAMGTASALNTSQGIWVKSSITGTFGLALSNDNGSSTIVNNITVNSANTWEYKAVNNLPARTSGSWNNSGLWGYMTVAIVAGGNFQVAGTNTWSNGVAFGSASQTNTHLTALNSTFQIALPQFNSGATANAFVHDPLEYGRVFRRYQKSYDQGTALGTVTNTGGEYAYDQNTAGFGFGHSKSFHIPMIGDPAMTYYSGRSGATGQCGDLTAAVDKAITPVTSSNKGFQLAVYNFAAGYAAMYHWTADSRLS